MIKTNLVDFLKFENLISFFLKKIQKIENIELGKFITNFTYIYFLIESNYFVRNCGIFQFNESWSLLEFADNPIQVTKQYQLLLHRK